MYININPCLWLLAYFCQLKGPGGGGGVDKHMINFQVAGTVIKRRLTCYE